MTTPTLPPALLSQLRALKKPVFTQEYEPSTPSDCPNCGGLGHVFVFVAESGPYRDVPPIKGGPDSVLKSVNDESYGWIWYVGKTVGAECPECKGIGKASSLAKLKQYNTAQLVKQLAEQFQR